MSNEGQTWMPENWSFKNVNVASHFEKHVREQLPWYDLTTKAVEHIARHYIPVGGNVYDIGASTGNIGKVLAPVLEERKASLISIEESKEMAAIWKGPGELKISDAVDYDFDMFDFAVLFLVLMFIPITKRKAFILKLHSLIKPGGAIVIVDKINTPPGYSGTVMRRMAMRWKLDSGTPENEIVRKELSLAGAQRPLDESILFPYAQKWFQFGEFAGWIIERGE